MLLKTSVVIGLFLLNPAWVCAQSELDDRFSISLGAFITDRDTDTRLDSDVCGRGTEIDFEGVNVDGELVKPSGALVMEVKRNQFNQLIRMRENFDKEMRQSIDEVK